MGIHPNNKPRQKLQLLLCDNEGLFFGCQLIITFIKNNAHTLNVFDKVGITNLFEN